MIEDNEAVYDEQISPLMTQIIELCKAHSIPFAAQFQYCGDDGEDGPGFVTTTLPVDGQDPQIARVISAMHSRSSPALHLRIDHGDGRQTLETIIP
jgi:hypothetical protein